MAGDRAQLTRLEARAKTFYETLGRGERERAAGQWQGLAEELAALGDRIQGSLDQMREEVMERDGDLEELYRSARWREEEVMGLVATYHLAWVRYQGAQLVGDAARKKALLRQSVDGFSQFLLVNEVPEIYAESLYGRGLAFLDLGENAKAIEDLRAASEQPGVGARARAALEEARRRGAGGKPSAAAPADDPQALLGRLGDLLPRAAGGEAASEKEVTTLARGLAARGGDWPARVTSSVLSKLGDGTPAGLHSSYGLLLLAQLAVDRGRCADVPALAEASAGVTDAGRDRHRPELLFVDAGCLLNAGRQREAAERFAVLEKEWPRSSRVREAAYYRFRALDLARSKDTSLDGAYEEALAGYLARFGRAEGAGEARFLRAELQRGRGDCRRALPEYAAVAGGPFAERARLGALECRVADLTAAGATATPAERRALVAALRAFARETPDRALGARAALVGALVAAGGAEPDHAAVVDLLDGYEQRYPAARELHPQAVELRLVARVASGQIAEAGRDLDAFLGARARNDGDQTTLARLARDLAARAERAPAGGPNPALQLARRAQTTLAERTGDARDRVVLADLEMRAGDPAAARRLYEQVLAGDGTSAEALRGAARTAAAGGDRAAALGYWRRVLEGSPPGGTAWYEARIAQVTLLSADGRTGEACELLRSSRGRATSTGGDQLEARLRAMEAEVCR